MNGHIGTFKTGLYLLLQAVTQPVRFPHTDTLRHNQMKVNMTLVSHLASA